MTVRLSAVAAFMTLMSATAVYSAQGPCADDAAKLCKEVKPGGGRMMACLKEHEASVSPACKEHLMEMKQKVKEAQKACHDDVANFCSDVKPGKKRIINCLRQHEAELSPECAEKLAHRKKP